MIRSKGKCRTILIFSLGGMAVQTAIYTTLAKIAYQFAGQKRLQKIIAIFHKALMTRGTAISGVDAMRYRMCGNESNVRNDKMNTASMRYSQKLICLSTVLIALLTAVIMSMACGGGETDNIVVPVSEIRLDKEAMTLQPTESFQLRAELFPANAGDRTINWTVTDSSKAIVSETGWVTALEAGYTDIIATTPNGVMATCRLTVKINVTGISIIPSPVSLSEGSYTTLTANILPPNATDKSVNWVSDYNSVATVSGIIDNGVNKGIVQALRPGLAIITVATLDGAYSATCRVTVEPAADVPVTDVTLNKISMSLPYGTSETLIPGILPSNATIKTVSWDSSDPDVAFVSSDGTVVGLKIGTATITVTTADGGFKATCLVSVVPAVVDVTSVVVMPTSLSLIVDESATVTAIVLPANATNKFVTWNSSDPAVAVVSSEPMPLGIASVTGVGSGKAIITATTVDGEFVSECEVSVADVYVAGYEENANGIAVARLWKNGVAQNDLSNGDNPAYATSVFVYNGVVYVTGYEIIGGTSWARLWINGSSANLGTGGKNNAEATSVFVAESRIYVVGWEEEKPGYPAAKLWMDGEPISLPYGNGRSKASSVYVMGDVVYVAGYEELAGVTNARLWVNDGTRPGWEPKQPGTGSANAVASSVFVLPNARICVAGYESTPQNTQARMARLWVDGEFKNLSNANNYASAFSVCASGSNVYAVGFENNAQLRPTAIARLWRWEDSLGSNAQSSSLGDGSYNSVASSVFVYGNKIYAAGYENNIHGRSAAMLWVDNFNRPITAGNTNARANAVFVR